MSVLLVHRTAEWQHLDRIEAVVRGTGLTSDLETVSNSWRRCAADLVIPADSQVAPHIVTENELRHFREPLGEAIACAQEEVDRLYAIVRQEGYVVLLCNSDGIAIHYRGDEAKAEQFKYWGIWGGGVWSENIEGTNGIGTCIAEQRPMLVHRDQHFRTRHIGLSCAGAPIFDPSGRLALVLDISSMTANQFPTLALAATKVAARGIEERLFRDHFRNLWLVFAGPFDGSIPALLLAVDSDLRIVGADRIARAALSLDDDKLSRGILLSAMFDFDRSVFRCQQEQDVLSRFKHVATSELWRVLITPPLCGWRGWRSSAELAIHSRARISLPNPEGKTIYTTEERLLDESIPLREEINEASMFEEIVGASPALQTVFSRISKVAPTPSTVLITGETGTGKELIARAIHRRSQRSSRPFVSVNCAAIPRDLIASELFGHEKGAFTGALQRRLGKFELAEGGTIFLDEIGEIPVETQIALLRVLQEHEFERVGGNQAIRTDVRVIAATNRDLQAAISAGIFRSDLFYRLNVFPIEVPPLRTRKEDIAMLAEYFIDRFARQEGKKIKSIDKKTVDLVQAYPWPGNIRELQNVIERSVVLCETEIFSVDESWLSRAPSSPPAASPTLLKKPVLQDKELIEAALSETRGRVSGPTGAAARLGIPSTTLESKIKSLKINKHHFKAA